VTSVPAAYILGVENGRLWACAEHGVIYSAPDDGTVYRDVTCPECGERLLRYPPPERDGIDRIFWLCSANPDHQAWDEAPPEDRRCPECGGEALAWRLSPVD
jgi:DNA-directed RNA polymerase subunit RPC12/RpoP